MDFKILTTKDKIWFSVAGLVVVAIIGAIIYFGKPLTVITVPVEITAEQRANTEKQIADIRQQLENCESEADKCYELYLQLGINYESLGEISRAIDTYEDAIDAKGDTYVPYSNIGSIYARLKDFAKAEEFYKKAIEISPNNASVYTKLFELYFYNQQKSYFEMEAFFPIALKDTNYDPNIVRLYAYWADSVNDPATAIKAWKAVLQYEPDNEAAKQKLEAATKKLQEEEKILNNR